MIWQYFEIVYENILYYYNNFFGIRNNNDFDQVMYKYLLTDSVNYNTSEVDKLIDDTMKEIKVDNEIQCLQERFDRLKTELSENYDNNTNNNNNNEGAIGCKVSNNVKRRCKLFC